MLLEIAVVIAVLFAVLVVFGRAYIYDAVITSMTSTWYRSVLERIPEGSRVLDIGIGTGKSLIANKDLIIKKKLTVVGVDYDNDYVKRCVELINENKLEDCVSVHHASIYDFMTPDSPTAQLEKFDVAYFSGSLMIMPDPKAALSHVYSLLKKGNNALIYITQTFETGKPNQFIKTIKPLLKFITTIDFGQVTYEPQFLNTVKDSGLTVKECVSIKPSSVLSSATAKQDRVFKLYTLFKK